MSHYKHCRPHDFVTVTLSTSMIGTLVEQDQERNLYCSIFSTLLSMTSTLSGTICATSIGRTPLTCIHRTTSELPIKISGS